MAHSGKNVNYDPGYHSFATKLFKCSSVELACDVMIKACACLLQALCHNGLKLYSNLCIIMKTKQIVDILAQFYDIVVLCPVSKYTAFQILRAATASCCSRPWLACLLTSRALY